MVLCRHRLDFLVEQRDISDMWTHLEYAAETAVVLFI
jgi:hypothetical protein